MAGGALLLWPTREGFALPMPPRYNIIGSDFGPRVHPIRKTTHQHNGIDLGMPTGTPLYAVEAGRIVRVDKAGTGRGVTNGNAVFLKGGSGLTWGYLHMDSTAVRPGQTVREGQFLGRAGNTGSSTSPHLHFTVWKKAGTFLDPVDLYPRGTWRWKPGKRIA